MALATSTSWIRAIGQVAHSASGVDIDVEGLEHLTGLPGHFPPVEGAEPGPQLASHEQVLVDRHLRVWGELLRDDPDAQAPSELGVGVVQRLAVDADLTGVGLQLPGDDLHQRRLAGAVLPGQHGQLTRVQVERDITQYGDAAETFRHVTDVQRCRHTLSSAGSFAR